jgi:hypothetical protein
MTQVDDPRQKELEVIADEAIRLGYLNGTDFFVWGVGAFVSSEVVEIGPEGADVVVWYRDRGQRQEITRARRVLRRVGATRGSTGSWTLRREETARAIRRDDPRSSLRAAQVAGLLLSAAASLT